MSTRRCMYCWEEDDVSGPLVRSLLVADDYSTWETRAFLRPLFRWLKIGLPKDGSREHDALERAFAFVEWLVQLATQGDATRNIPRLPALQPSYALNTIVTASQRAGRVREAQRAFDLLKWHGYLPDVFTYTALIDVIARNGDMAGAMKTYEEMRLSPSKPNIVTYTTLIRAVGLKDSVETAQCLVFLARAREDGAFDEALVLEALETCARRKDRAVATRVLNELATHSPRLRRDDRFFYTLGQVARLLDDENLEPVLTEWVERDLLSFEERGTIVTLQQQHEASTASDGLKPLGCLGHQTTRSVRKAVIHHDINRLISRIHSGAIVNVNDFETLIHQCRKRKWKEDVSVIVNAMRDLATKGWQPSSGTGESKLIPPQPQLQPTSKTYVAIVDAYMCCGDEPLGWQVVQEMEHLPNITRELALYRKFVHGAYLLTNCDHIAELLALAQEDKIIFTHRMGVEVARMFGFRHEEGFDILAYKLPIGEHGVRMKRQGLMEELMKSCAYKSNSAGAETTLQAMLTHGFQRSATTEIALFMCCMQHDTVSEAQAMLQHFPDTSLMILVPVYDSLLREFYFKYTRRGNVFDESSRKIAMKTLHARRAIFELVFKDRDILETEKNAALVNAPDHDSACFRYWCSRANVSCSPLMFSQHAVQVLTTSRDKDSKNAAEQSIRDALMIAPDPCLFLLQSVVALRFLDLTFRTLGKLAKQLLVVVTDELPVEERHAEYCASQLPVLSVHIVKELDDVVLLHQTHRADLLAFCQDALDTESIDKMMGFLMRRPELYDAETALYLGPKLAEIFVYGSVSNVLMFFKPNTDDTLNMRRQFVRDVMAVEKTVAAEKEGASLPFRCTFQALQAFQLEHAAEFRPYVTHARAAMPTLVYADASATPVDDTRYLTIPLARDHLVVVDSDETLAVATLGLGRACVTRLGLDAEWRPDSQKGVRASKCSILQVACDDYVFLFDLMALGLEALDELLTPLFASPTIVKLGFALDSDMQRLRWSFPAMRCFDTLANVVDFSLATLEARTYVATDTAVTWTDSFVGSDKRRLRGPPRRPKGLSAYIRETLGYPLLKLQQTSDWACRPLTVQQVAYAALDAFCLLMLHDAVLPTSDSRHGQPTTTSGSRPSTSGL